MKFNFFRRGDNQVMGRDVKVAMIQAAPQGELFYEDVADAINYNLATPELITPTLFALTRATGMLLKSLDKVEYPLKDQYKGSFNNLLPVSCGVDALHVTWNFSK